MKQQTKQKFACNQPNFNAPAPLKCYYSTPCEIKQLPTFILQSSQAYQRPVDPKHVKEIIDNFNSLYLDEVIVSFRDGKYYVVDGQNRIRAMLEMNNNQPCVINCKVYYGLSYEDEASMFYHLDGIRGRLKYVDGIRAKIEAGDDETVNAIVRMLGKYGISWNVTMKKAPDDREICASKALVDLYNRMGGDQFDYALQLLMLWGGAKETMRSEFIKGVCLFVRAYGSEINKKLFAQKVVKFTPAKIKADTKLEVKARNTATKYAKVFLDKYNRGSANKLDPRLID